MNVLTLVFSLLLILSYGFYACWDKGVASSRLRTTYAGHSKAQRKILNSYQSAVYENLGHRSEVKKEEEEEIDDEVLPQNKKTEKKKPKPNRECAKLNLWPLIQEGRQAHPILYELAAKLLRTFYGALHKGDKQFEYRLLDSLLSCAKLAIQNETPSPLEKIDLQNPDLQKIYYKMLKGTKTWNLSRHEGYPSLLDYVKADPLEGKICLFHAHPDQITVIFNEKIAAGLYEEIHQKQKPLFNRDLIERIAAGAHQIALDPDLLDLLELGYPSHKESKKTFTSEEGEVFLKKNIGLQAAAVKNI